MIKTLLWSVALYGSETWTMRKEDIKKIEAFEMWTLRRMEKIDQLDGTQNKRGSSGKDWRGKNNDKNNQRKTKEMDRAYAKRRQPGKNGDRRKNGGEKNKRKTTTDDVGLDDDKRLQKAERRGPTTRGVATSDI